MDYGELWSGNLELKRERGGEEVAG